MQAEKMGSFGEKRKKKRGRKEEQFSNTVVKCDTSPVVLPLSRTRNTRLLVSEAIVSVVHRVDP